MLRKLQALSPAFLNKFDHYLLVNYPAIWATKIHQILFVGAIGLVLLTLKAFITPFSLENIPDADMHFGLLMIPVAIIVALWGVRVYQFKPEKYFGQRKAGQWFLEQAIYASGILMLLTGPIAYNMILNERIDAHVDDQMFAQDVFVLEMGSEYYLEDGNYHDYGAYHLRDEEKFSTFQQVLSVPAESHEHLGQIQLLIDTHNRYSSEKFPYPASHILESFSNRSSYFDLQYDKTLAQASEHARALARIKTDLTLFSDLSSMNMLLMMVLFTCLAFAIFQQASWKQFLIAGVSAAAGGLIIGLASEFLDNAVQYSRQEDWAILIGMGVYGLLLTQIFGNKNTRLLAAWKGIAVLIVSMGFPVLCMFFLGWSDILPDPIHIEFTVVLLVIAGISYGVWNGLYRLRLDKIQASPTKN